MTALWPAAVLLVFTAAWGTALVGARSLYRRGRINEWVTGAVTAVAIVMTPPAAAIAGRVGLPLDIWLLMGILPALAAFVVVVAILKRQRG